jgi:putative hydrolase of HD superfamily
LPEALTRDIISPVKYSVKGLDDIIQEFEIKKIEEEILPFIPVGLVDEFNYILGIIDGKKDEFCNRIYKTKPTIVDTLNTYNEDRFRAIDGAALKACDNLSAFIEAVLSISHGVKSKELESGKEQIKEKLEKINIINGVNFRKLSDEIEEYFLTK